MKYSLYILTFYLHIAPSIFLDKIEQELFYRILRNISLRFCSEGNVKFVSGV